MWWVKRSSVCRMTLAMAFVAMAVTAADAESGYQVINGTRVFTVIDHAAGTATFSNDCGSQTLTQRQLQAGAIPDRISPCPRPGRVDRLPPDTPRRTPPPLQGNNESWGAVAAALWRDSSGTAHVRSGYAANYPTEEAARNAALSKCEEGAAGNCRIVGTFHNGGCGYIAVGNSSRGVSWGAGATAAAAESECRQGGEYDCNRAIGGCTTE